MFLFIDNDNLHSSQK